VIVVDNNSKDDSLKAVEYLSEVTVIRNLDNRGFAAACNQGAMNCTADFVLFLNPDTILSPGSLASAINYMCRPEHSTIGVLGIRLHDASGSITRNCARFPTPAMLIAKAMGLNRVMPRWFPSYMMVDWDHATSQEVDHVIGAFYLVRTELFNTLRGFDQRFYVYLEDVDFSLRAHRCGWKVYYLADVSAFHKGGGVSEQIKATRLAYALESRVRYAAKHFNVRQAGSVITVTLLIEPLVRIIRALLSFSAMEVLETIGGYAQLWRNLCRGART